MTEEKIDSCVELVIKYNPTDEHFSKEEYSRLLYAHQNGDTGATDKLRQLTFNYCLDWLLKDYIENDRNPEEFEDEIMDSYMFSTTMPLDIHRFGAFSKALNRELGKFFEKSRADKLEKNIYLNYEWDGRIQDIVDEESQEAFDIGGSDRDIYELLERYNRRYKKMTDERKQVAIEALGIFTEEHGRKEIAQKYGLSQEQVLATTAKYLRDLRKECFEESTKLGKDLSARRYK